MNINIKHQDLLKMSDLPHQTVNTDLEDRQQRKETTAMSMSAPASVDASSAADSVPASINNLLPTNNAGSEEKHHNDIEEDEEDTFQSLVDALENAVSSLLATIDKKIQKQKPATDTVERSTTGENSQENQLAFTEENQLASTEENQLAHNKKKNLHFVLDLEKKRKAPKKKRHHGKTICSQLCFLLGSCLFLFISMHDLKYAKEYQLYLKSGGEAKETTPVGSTTNIGDPDQDTPTDIPDTSSTTMESLPPRQNQTKWISWSSTNNDNNDGDNGDGDAGRKLQQVATTVPTIEELFDVIERALIMPKATVNVNYQLKGGFPTRIFIQTGTERPTFYWTLFSLEIDTQGKAKTVTDTLFRHIDTQAKEALIDAKRSWYQQGIESYSFKCSGASSYDGTSPKYPWTIRVNANGKVASVIDNIGDPVGSVYLPALHDNQDLLMVENSDLERYTLAPVTEAPTPSPTIQLYKYVQWDAFYFSELPEEIRMSAMAIGYNEESWDEDMTLSTFFISWDNLTVEQRSAAETIGFTETDWNAYTFKKTGVSHTEAPTPSPRSSDTARKDKQSQEEPPTKDTSGISSAKGLAGTAFVVVGLTEWKRKAKDGYQSLSLCAAGILIVMSAIFMILREGFDIGSQLAQCLSFHFFLLEASLLARGHILLTRERGKHQRKQRVATNYFSMVADTLYLIGSVTKLILSYLSFRGGETEYSINLARIGVCSDALWICRTLIYVVGAMILIGFRVAEGSIRRANHSEGGSTVTLHL